MAEQHIGSDSPNGHSCSNIIRSGLCEGCPREESPAGLKIKLYDSQCAILYEMLSIEKTNHRCAKFTERFSFGKTISILGLISRTFDAPEKICAFDADNDSHYGFGVLQARCKLLPMNVIYVSTSVLQQWIDSIAQYTQFTTFVVHDLRTLCAFLDNIRAQKFPQILLVRVGILSSRDIPGIENSTVKIIRRQISESIFRSLFGFKVIRSIVDDYGLMSGDEFILPANFTWLVGANEILRSIPSTICEYYAGRTAQSAVSSYMMAARELRRLSNSKSITGESQRNVFCTEEFSNLCAKMHKIKYHLIRVRGGVASKYMEIALYDPDIIELLNAGAFVELSAKLGTTLRNAYDVIKFIITNQLNEKNTHQTALNIARNIIEQAPQHTDIRNGVRAETVLKIIELITDHNELQLALVLSTISNFYFAKAAAFSNFVKDLEKKIEQIDNKLDKFTESVLGGECQCCLEPLNVPNISVFIMAGCCQTIYCSSCMFPQTTMVPRCLNCQNNIDKSTIIRVSGGTLRSGGADSPTADGSPADGAADSPIETMATTGESAAPSAGDNKHRAIVSLCKGEPVDCIEHIVLPHGAVEALRLTEGELDVEPVGLRYNKILLYAGNASACRAIHAMLGGAGIASVALSGTTAQRRTILNTFKYDAAMQVMTVTDQEDCGGIHMPFVDVVIFYYTTKDIERISQFAARAQRCGRTCNLQIYFLLYEEEANNLAN